MTAPALGPCGVCSRRTLALDLFERLHVTEPSVIVTDRDIDAERTLESNALLMAPQDGRRMQVDRSELSAGAAFGAGG